MLKWLRLSGDERQNLTTYSMMGGTMALTVAIGLLVWVLRYSWPEAVVVSHAAAMMNYLFYIILAFIGLQAVQVVAQAVIAIGGRMKASFGGASVEASDERAVEAEMRATVTTHIEEVPQP